jgi:hypothetical protein
MSDDGAPMPRCTTCEHAWHGLPCGRHVYATLAQPYQTSRCTCRGPFATTTEETTP